MKCVRSESPTQPRWSSERGSTFHERRGSHPNAGVRRSITMMPMVPGQFWSFGEGAYQRNVCPLLSQVACGYEGPEAKWPRKYVKGELKDAYKHPFGMKHGMQEYHIACKNIGAEPNSCIEAKLRDVAGVPMEAKEFLGGEWISLRDTYVGERGFIALLPLLDRNSSWTSLDASNNGLRNEAVLHLVDLCLRPPHVNRVLHLDLSKNPISEAAGRAILQFAQKHPHPGHINMTHTKVSRRLQLRIREAISSRHVDVAVVCVQCGNFFMADSRFCMHCGANRKKSLMANSGIFDDDFVPAAIPDDDEEGSDVDEADKLEDEEGLATIQAGEGSQEVVEAAGFEPTS